MKRREYLEFERIQSTYRRQLVPMALIQPVRLDIDEVWTIDPIVTSDDLFWPLPKYCRFWTPHSAVPHSLLLNNKKLPRVFVRFPHVIDDYLGFVTYRRNLIRL